MRLSEFWRLMEEEFGAAYARSLAREHVVGALGHRTAEQALADSVAPREVWVALCRELDVPPSRHFGRDLAQRRLRSTY